MRIELTAISALALILAASTIGGAAHSSPQTSQGQNAQQSQPGMMGQGMMGGGMMGMMGQMTSHHQQMTTLMAKLMDSMAAIQNEKDPAALKAKLADHAALLKQMHDQMMQQGNMMQSMSGRIRANCPAAVDNGKTPPK
jgi:hypothetical protein